jgi:hypothetical protein
METDELRDESAMILKVSSKNAQVIATISNEISELMSKYQGLTIEDLLEQEDNFEKKVDPKL